MKSESTISLEDKKEFIQWFLKQFKLKKRECVWILDYLRKNDHLLRNVYFVDSVVDCSRGMLISTVTGNENKLPFKFIKGNLMSDNPEQAFHDIRLHPDEPIYIDLNFRDKQTCVEYMAVSESHNSSEVLSPAVLEEAEKIIDDLQRQMLLKEIDKALDNGDQKMFMELWEQLNEVGVRYSAYAN